MRGSQQRQIPRGVPGKMLLSHEQGRIVKSWRFAAPDVRLMLIVSRVASGMEVNVMMRSPAHHPSTEDSVLPRPIDRCLSCSCGGIDDGGVEEEESQGWPPFLRSST
jgi:hypothetical protein